MPTEYSKKPVIEYKPPLEGIVPDISITQHCETLVSTAAKDMVSSTLTLENSQYSEQPDEQIVIVPVPLSGEVELADGAVTATITNTGKVTLSDTPDDDEIVDHKIEIEISDTNSLRSLAISAPTRLEDNPFVVELENYVSGSYVKAYEATGHAGKPIQLNRSLFHDSASIKVNILFQELGEVVSDIIFMDNIDGFLMVLDFKNSAENMLSAGLVGLAAGVAVSAGMEFLAKQLGSNSFIQDLVKILGVTALDAITAFLGSLSIAISKGWATWDDFTLDNIINGLKTSQALASMGLIGANLALQALVGPGVMQQVANMLTSGGVGFLLASAYLQVLAVNKRWVYLS